VRAPHDLSSRAAYADPLADGRTPSSLPPNMRTVTAARMRRIDQAAIHRYGIPVLLLMDNAGRSVAEIARDWLRRRHGKKVIVVCGGGNNGGDGVAAARYLTGWGYAVRVYYLKNPQSWRGDPAAHFRIARRMGVPFEAFGRIPPRERLRRLRRADVLIDALLGTGTRGPLRVPFFDAIAAMNAAKKPIIAVDLPSGLDPDTGDVDDIAVKARATVTLAAPKRGLLQSRARRHVGKLIVADIGVPSTLLPKANER
jgi:hydroxyethylthiazole kinase-like uncharacterized protein yjeF